MATLYRANGKIEAISPKEGTSFSLKELQTFVGGYIEVVEATDGRMLVCDEEGKVKGRPMNRNASLLYMGGADTLVGDVVAATRKELGDEDDDAAALKELEEKLDEWAKWDKERPVN